MAIRGQILLPLTLSRWGEADGLTQGCQDAQLGQSDPQLPRQGPVSNPEPRQNKKEPITSVHQSINQGTDLKKTPVAVPTASDHSHTRAPADLSA